jgi:maltose/moltooligosaccharide transporter
MFAIYSIVCFLVAFILPKLARISSRKTVHALALFCGGVGLLSMYFVTTPNGQYLSMVGVGIAWASILAMPYAILSNALPAARMGVYMGVFNFFIVIPEILASLLFGRIIRAIFGEGSRIAPLYVVLAGGAFMVIAACLVLMVKDVGTADVPEEAVMRADEEELLGIPESVQAVPSTGMIDKE